MNNHSIAVVYHGGCNDGTASAWAAWCCLGDRAEYIPWRYGDRVPQVDGKVVIMVDISPKPEEVEELRASVKALMIVDHHDSSTRLLSDLKAVTTFKDFMEMVDAENGISIPVAMYADKSRSGAVLSWLFFNNVTTTVEDDIPKALILIEDYDLYKKVNPDTVPFNEWFASTGRYIDNFDAHINPDGTPKEDTLYIGRLLAKKSAGVVRDIMRNYLRFIDWRGYRVGIVNAPSFIRNEVAEEVLKKYAGVNFVLVFQIRAKKVVFSARGRDKSINLSLIAADFGGGGHEDAAAFSIDLGDKELLDTLGISEDNGLPSNCVITTF